MSQNPLRRLTAALSLFVSTALIAVTSADVVINELVSTNSGRLLRWDGNDQPYAGGGPAWWSSEFNDADWNSGNTPIGFALGSITTNLASKLQNVSPSMYVRKEFNVSAGDAASGNDLILRINYNDGYIAWLNGIEGDRANMGQPKAHVFHDQLAYRAASSSTTAEDVNLGPASGFLVAGTNVLAIQINNQNISSSMRLEMQLFIDGPGGSDTELVPFGSQVRYLPGLLEPSGDLFEPALLDDPALENEPSDWIELYNNGASAVDLSNWALTDDDSNTTKWLFPTGASIAAGGYLVVMADQPDAPITGAQYLHTNFKLSGGGEYLGLFDASGTVQSEYASEFPNQYANYSYGLDASGGSAYFAVPSPGSANPATGLSGKVDAPDYDIEGGFFPTPQTVTLTSMTPGAQIRYTTDGSAPTASSTLYTAPLTLNQVSNKSGHVIRARAFVSGMIPSNTKTNTYLIQQDSRLTGNPSLIFTGDPDRKLHDPFGVTAIVGGTYSNNNWVATGVDDVNNFINRGRPYERKIHAEFYFPDGSAGFRTDCGLRPAASSWSRPRMQMTNTASSPWPADSVQKCSFNLYFRDDYGNPSVNLPLNGLNSPLNNYERFRIRAGKNDIKNPFVIDELMRRLSHDMGQGAVRGVNNTLYINGELKGFYNMVERLRAPFFSSLYSDDKDADWDVLAFQGDENVADGDKIAWNDMITRLNAPVTLANWESVLELADVENMADYYLLNIWGATWDWPHNNWVAAKERSPAGRYRLFVWDAEGGMNNRGNRPVSQEMIETFIADGAGELRDLWRGLNRWKEFQLLFADRVNKHMFNGGVLDDRDYASSHMKARFDELVTDFTPLLSFMNNEAVQTTKPAAWANTTSGRRNYLFGPTREEFRDNDLWPATLPPAFSVFGGSVAENFPLNVTNESGDVYYTTDGSDPRLPGGTANPNATSQPGSKLDEQLIAPASMWSYSDTDGDLGTAWSAPAFDDSAWLSGPGPLGFGGIRDPNTGTNLTLGTTVNQGSPRQVTVYFRKELNITNAASYLELRMGIMSDGGGAVYLNGVEAFRDENLAAGAGYSDTTSSDASDSDEGDYDEYLLDPLLLVEGTNIIAVEMHNVSPASSDMVMDLWLDATRTNPSALPVIIDQPMTVMARSFENGEWSALTTANFTVDSMPASAANLAISSMLYNPAGPSAAEQAAGFTDGDEFEYLQLANTGPNTISLENVSFVSGISFDFSGSNVTALQPGGIVLIVRNMDAFRLRFGNSHDALIAGQYTGKLNNGGENIRLIAADQLAIHDFDFDTSSPWPDLDGALDGHAIVNIAPAGNHDDGANWQASATTGGSPGGSLSFTAWLPGAFTTAQLADPAISGADADPDNDGLSNLVEFALGTPPLSSTNILPPPSVALTTVAAQNYLDLSFTVAGGTRDADFDLEISSDLVSWSDTSSNEISRSPHPDGSVTITLRASTPFDLAVDSEHFARLKISG